jgi:uncharacterized protein YbaR (Trm112 family)
MEIICEQCKAKLNIPVEKIPQGQRVIIHCPKCKHKLTLEYNSPKKEDKAPVTQDKTDQEVSTPEIDDGYEDEDLSLVFYEEGVKLALVMENEISGTEKLERTIEKLGYRSVSAKSTRDAIGKMRFHHFDLMILSDLFDGIELEESPVLQYLNHLPMSIRRRIFLALIGDTFKTMDHMMAFAMSANLVINRRDLDTITAILVHAVSDHDKFYKVFMDVLAELGKV